jgi:hypothetical protein
VPALDEEVGGDDHVTGPHPQHRGVVAGPDEDVLALREQLGEAGDQPELADVGERRACGQRGGRHGHILSPAGTGGSRGLIDPTGPDL